MESGGHTGDVRQTSEFSVCSGKFLEIFLNFKGCFGRAPGKQFSVKAKVMWLEEWEVTLN